MLKKSKFNSVKKRYDALKDLINNNKIENQEELVKLLRERYDIDVNQSIISRDLRALNVSKQPYGDLMIYELPKKDATRELLRLSVHKIVYNETLIVVHTPPGYADFVGDFIDEHADDIDVLGTIAGENTVFVVPASIKNIEHIYQRLVRALEYKVSI